MSEQETNAPVVITDSKTKPIEKSPHILVVDDDQVLLNLFDKVLKKLGFRVALVDNGRDAIDLVRKTTPDVVLLDIKMPGMDGISTLKEIKAQDPDIEVIIITGFASLDSAVEALKYGAFDYIRKPFDRLDQVVDAIRRGWERRTPRLQRRNLKTSQERKIYELKILYNISRMIGSCSDRKEMMVQLLDSLCKIINYDLAISMFTEGSEPKELILQVANLSSPSFVGEAKSNLIDAFNSTSHSRISNDIAFDRILGEENIKSTESMGQKSQGSFRIAQKLSSFLNVPLMNNGNMMGMINVSSHRDNLFTPDDIRLIYTVVSQVPSAIQRLNGIKAAERSRMSRLTENVPEGVIMIDECFEVVFVNSVAQKILSTENPDIETIQNILGLDLKRFKAQMEEKHLDLIRKQTKIKSQSYEVITSIIETPKTFMGFVISIRQSAKEK